MGNGKSQPAGLLIEDKAFIANNFWTLHNAVYGNETERNVTVFAGVADTKGEFSALEMFSKNLMLHRHPNILKYVASWRVNDQVYLATEEVNTLQNVISKQTSLQICIGLHSILNAISFLHEKAHSSHNNICQASVYVTPEGHWKLAGLEYLCRFSDLSARFLSDSRQGRYDRGISPSENNRVPQPPCAIDQYAFGVFVEEILKSRTDENVPGLLDFLNIAKTELQTADCKARPSFRKLLEHPYFTHQFIYIHNFLTELPLKSGSEKQIFFRELTNKLSEFNEDVVAGQLGSLLLSRILLLDNSAQEFLLPQMLKPRIDENSNCIFSEKTFKEYIVPKLVSIFHVRDTQVRLILLTYFQSFTTMCCATQLRSEILPELLVGIKDTNDELVAATLKALSELVPILGAATVVGGKRSKLFSDGRPKVRSYSKRTVKNIVEKTKEVDAGTVPVEESAEMFLKERPSPDGGEAQSVATPVEEAEQWDSWETPNNPSSENIPHVAEEPVEHTNASENKYLKENSVVQDSAKSVTAKQLADLDVLDVKSQPISAAVNPEEDFFRDMEPVICKTHVVHISDPQTSISERKLSKFEVTDEIIGSVDEGWGDELEWADVNEVSNF
ncbi:protein-associating with the carboxyl-terminal domain of ezrin isoform X2 [Rhodnius prolixus]|uniref:protein-associating with the carboxyl-terminal domain of ezrin isoform X2 n=1 Tax=Rhodnius prolixus TaxID=13249 RepID=UPI003D187BB7